LLSVVDNIALNQDFLQSADRTMVCATLFYMLLTGVVCLKHEGFDEEREWRMIYSPGQRFSSLISRSLEVIEGVPQMIYKIPLDGSTPDTAQIDIAHLIDRVIIGPSQYPWPMFEAFVAALADAGIADPRERVFVSDIPIRG
jgi:hypothetical protein